MKKTVTILLALCFVLSLFAFSGCSCDSLELKDDGFGFSENTPAMSDSSVTVSGSDEPEKVYSDKYADYVIPENSAVEYPRWKTCNNDDFKAFAAEKLTDMAKMTVELCASKDRLSQCSDPDEMIADRNFIKLVNNLRAWRYGCDSFSVDTLSEKNKELCASLSGLGSDVCEYATRLPALLLTGNDESVTDYENRIIGEISVLGQKIDR